MSDEKMPSEEEGAPPPPPQASPPPPPPAAAGGNNILMLILAYLGIFALIPFLMEKENKEVHWHAKHGLVFFGAEIILYVALVIIGFIPVIGTIIGCLTMIVAPLLILILHIVAILKAIKGERLLIPGLSDFADKF